MESKIFSIRFNRAQFNSLTNEATQQGIKLGKLIRNKLGIENKSDIRRIIFLLNKTSNNINQIAKGINIANLSNRVNDNMYIQVLTKLSLIQNDFKTFYNLVKNIKNDN